MDIPRAFYNQTLIPAGYLHCLEVSAFQDIATSVITVFRESIEVPESLLHFLLILQAPASH